MSSLRRGRGRSSPSCREGDSADTVARLFDAGVVVRDIPETGWVRVSCGYWNTEEHLQRLLDALA